MNFNIRFFSLIIFLLCLSEVLFATHNRAGEITYRQTGPLSIEVKITTYTKISGQAIHADRPSLDIHWGDGTVSTIPRDNFVMVDVDIRRNEYIATHNFPGPNPGGQPYIMWMQDPNRNENILNINSGNSVNIEFYLQTEVFLFPTSIFGFNSSPILLEPPIDFGVVGQIFQHTPNGYDPDGDSVAYELIVPASNVSTPVPGYRPVSDIGPGPLNSYTFDVRTGLFTWNAPQIPGEYNIAILVKSYRNGLYLGGIVRDIQIEIRDAQNTPPQIEVPEEICVEAGSLIEFDVIARDQDVPQQVVTLTATGGALLPPNNATFSNANGFSPLSSRFRWQTSCDNIQQQPYQIVFKARDTYFTNGGQVDASLSTFKVLLIRIVGPPVQNLQSNVSSGQVKLTWDSPYVCDNSDNFLGFSVWRKTSCDPFIPDTCDLGLAGRGYTQLNFGSLVTTPVGPDYEFTDNTVQSGGIYSYRIVAEFATPLAGTNNFSNPVSGRASEEKCVQMAQDLPLMTNVDVETTDLSNGRILVRWARPKANELDTIINTAPYRYELYSSDDLSGSNFLLNPIWSSPVYNSFTAMGDTTNYLDTVSLNTKEKPHCYRVAFYSNGDTLGFTSIASSVFLQVSSTDRTNILSWNEIVPWINYQYVVFLESPTGSGNFVVLDTVTTRNYTHNGLNNEETYCYYIESTGTYGMPGFLDSLVNKSQIACGTPIDTVAPCPPIELAGIESCDIIDDDTNNEGRSACEGAFVVAQEDFFNKITWKRNSDSCSGDAASYNLYFSPMCNGVYELVDSMISINDSVYMHQPNYKYNSCGTEYEVTSLAGCYYLTSVDSIEGAGGGNEGANSTIVETDNCPFYELPNVFTPNADEKNDLFVPCLKYRFIESVDFKVFNKWGQLVFETCNPRIEWNGKDMKTDQQLAEDVYFYTCEVRQICMKCPAVKTLKGTIHIILGAK